MVVALGALLSRWSRRFVPDPLVLAILLTLVSALVALPRVDWQPLRLSELWVGSGGRGMWSLLKFAMQMSLILVTGHVLAETRAVRAVIERLARLPADTASAAALVAAVAMVFALINWGLGLIVGALLARDVGRLARLDGRPLHYPLVVAAGYTGLMVWHGGFSGSAPLKATSAEQLADVLGADLAGRVQPMLLGDTIGSTLNLVVMGLCLLGVPALLALMAPSEGLRAAPASLLDAVSEERPQRPPHPTIADRLNHSPWVVALPVLLGLGWLVSWLGSQGLGRLNPDVVNLAMFVAGLALHGSARAYAAAVDRAVRGTGGIVIQFPLYAGIMGIMAGSGLIDWLAGGLGELGPRALTVATFYLGGLVNLFVPSGGGQWAVQGPIVMEAALQAGAAPAKVLMALSYGDQWTNMVQPFWALPLLGICQVKASDIIGYTAVLLLVGQLFFVVPLLVL